MFEKNRHDLDITEYALSETTLEQIFISFAKQQEEEKDKVEGLDNIQDDKAVTVVYSFL